MRIFSTLAVAAMVSVIGSVSPAANILASDPDGLVAFFQDQGIPAKLTIDNYGEPLIEARYFGTKFSIYFYGCNNGENCRSVQFFSGYQTNGSVSLEQVNSWNRDKRYARSYLSNDLDVRIEHDIHLGNVGMSQGDFDNMFSLWTKNMADFEKYIDW